VDVKIRESRLEVQRKIYEIRQEVKEKHMGLECGKKGKYI
jgi:hypothetical protein